MSPNALTELRRRLAGPLPGRRAQRTMAPELSFGRHFHRPPAWARPAAVVALLYPGEDGWRLPLVRRPDWMKDHAGQIGLPGGAVETGESPRDAALRELEEELGVKAADVVALGPLSDLYLFNSGFAVRPWVAAMDHQPQLVPNPDEVAEVLQVRLPQLWQQDARGEFGFERHGLTFRAPGFHCQAHVVWGATSMILAELAAVARGALD